MTCVGLHQSLEVRTKLVFFFSVPRRIIGIEVDFIIVVILKSDLCTTKKPDRTEKMVGCGSR